MSYVETIIIMAFTVYICYCQEERLFYSSMKKYCKKNNGACENCTCWSCPRKLYIDEYKMKERENNENKNF